MRARLAPSHPPTHPLHAHAQYWSVDLVCQKRKEADRHVVSIDGYGE